MHELVLIGGPYDGRRAKTSYQPDYIQIENSIYARIDDPETGESLNAYAFES